MPRGLLHSAYLFNMDFLDHRRQQEGNLTRFGAILTARFVLAFLKNLTENEAGKEHSTSGWRSWLKDVRAETLVIRELIQRRF